MVGLLGTDCRRHPPLALRPPDGRARGVDAREDAQAHQPKRVPRVRLRQDRPATNLNRPSPMPGVREDVSGVWRLGEDNK